MLTPTSRGTGLLARTIVFHQAELGFKVESDADWIRASDCDRLKLARARGGPVLRMVAANVVSSRRAACSTWALKMIERRVACESKL
jgi:hypothetical protein